MLLIRLVEYHGVGRFVSPVNMAAVSSASYNYVRHLRVPN
jgi:hypothetical protein